MRSHIMRWLKTPEDRAYEADLNGALIQIEHLQAQVRELYDLLDEYRDTGTLVLPPRRLWP